MTLEQYCECAKCEAMWCPVHGRGDDPRVAHRLRELLADLQQARDEQEASIAGYEERCIELYAGRDSWRRVAERLEREKGELRAQCNRVLEQLGTARRDYEVMNNFRRGAEKERDKLQAKCEELETENKRLRAELFATSMAEASPDDVDKLKDSTVTVCRTPGGQLEYVQDDTCNKPSCPVRRGFVKPGSCPWCKYD